MIEDVFFHTNNQLQKMDITELIYTMQMNQLVVIFPSIYHIK